jgi:hypothetical protein
MTIDLKTEISLHASNSLFGVGVLLNPTGFQQPVGFNSIGCLLRYNFTGLDFATWGSIPIK